MPSSPAHRREARASRREEKVYPRARCMNCPKFFAKTKPHKKFCCRACKDQFNKFGGAYGKLKEKLFAEIHKEVRERTAEQLSALEKRVLELENRVSGIVSALPTEQYLAFLSGERP